MTSGDSPSNSLSETFSLLFCTCISSNIKIKTGSIYYFRFLLYHCEIKAFGKGTKLIRGKPFLRKVCPCKLPIKLQYKYHTYNSGSFGFGSCLIDRKLWNDLENILLDQKGIISVCTLNIINVAVYDTVRSDVIFTCTVNTVFLRIE